MKLLPPDWPQSNNSRAVGFFAQTALELVHDKSWESYKLPTLSPLWRVAEAQRVAESIIRGILPQKALDPIVSEANASLGSDPVCRNIMANKGLEISDLKIAKEEKAHDIYAQCGFLLKICNEEYRKTAEDILVLECFGRGRRSEIYLILQNYFSELVLEGQSRASIEFSIRERFFEKTPSKIDKNTLRRFFAKFPKKRMDFRVYGYADAFFVKTMQRLLAFEVVAGRSLPRNIKSIVPEQPDGSYFVMTTEARDNYSAVTSAGKILGVGEALLKLFPGENMGSLPQYLYAAKRGSSDYIKAPTKPQFSKRVLSYSAASALRHMDRVGALISGAVSERSDFIIGSDFLRATMTASLADNSTAVEVKLLTIWAAFEALLPLVPETATNRISHFLDYIVPAVTLSYARNCFVEFSRDAKRLHNREYLSFLNDIPRGKFLADKLAAVVINGDEAQRRELCEVFENNPLALFRLKSLYDRFSDADSFERTINTHSNRVKWQIQRIYRERNTVMHNGESSPFIDQLLSNTYYYYIVSFTNIEAVSRLYGGLSIPQALSAIRKLCQSDAAKLNRAKSLKGGESIEAQAILLQLASGPFYQKA